MAASRILLVDDNAAILSILKPVLETRGFAITTAISAADGVMKLAKGEFELVLTDMKMETDAAGYDVARAAAAKLEAPVIVILTAFPLLAQQWREAGAHAVLSKPISGANLLEAVDRLLSVRRATKPVQSQKTGDDSPDLPRA